MSTIFKRRGSSSYSERPCRDPAFHETKVFTVPLRPTGFFKIVFGPEIDPFSFLSVFLNAIVTLHLITIFHNTTVNVESLSPPLFEKIVPSFKNVVFIILFFLRLR